MKTEITKLPAKLSEAVENSKINDLPEAQKIAANYAPFLNEVTEIANKVHELSIDNPGDLEIAKRSRLDLGKIASRATDQKKVDKDLVLIKGRFIDSLFNVVNGAARLTQEEAKKIENHHANIERERLEKLQSERVQLLHPYVEDANERDLSGMDSDVWDAYLSTKKKAHEDLIAAQKKVEEERLAKIEADRIENERIRKDNERLEAEAKERDRLAKIEQEKRKKIESERIAKESTERKSRQETAAKERAENEAKLKAEREAREKIESELKAKQQAEEKAKAEAAARIESELSKGDSAKVKDMIAELESIKNKYSFKSAKNKSKYKSVGELIDKVVLFINK